MTVSKLAAHRRTSPVHFGADAIEHVASRDTECAVHDAPQEPVPASALFDLVIIGAGPAAVAVLTRLLESRPAALYLEDEHRYLHWLHSKGNPGGGKAASRRSQPASPSAGAAPLLRTRYRPGSTERAFVQEDSFLQSSPASAAKIPRDGRRPLRILVIDRIGGWLGLWNRLFAAYEIPHLRSPMFFHPSPADLDALVAFAERKQRNTTGSWQPQSWVQDGRAVLANDSKAPSPGRRARGASDVAREGFASHMLSPEPIEIPGCVGKEITKHRRKKARADGKPVRGANQLGAAVNERDRRDYFTPGTRLFRDFVHEDLLQRYGIPGAEAGQPWPAIQDDLRRLETSSDINPEADPAMSRATGESHCGNYHVTVSRGEVNHMSWHHDLHIAGQGHEPAMLLSTSDGTRIAARTVVSAVGPGGMPNIPDIVKAAVQQAPSRDGTQTSPPQGPFGMGWAHSAAFALPHFVFPPPHLQRKDDVDAQKGPTCLVIGGGLTSAQLCLLALRKGFGKVILVFRRHVQVKPFDVGLDWLSKWANTMKMAFWQEDDPAERLKMLRAARDGGSITPAYARHLRQLERAGVLEIRTHTELTKLAWDDASKQWDVELECTCAQRESDSSTSAVHSTCEPCQEPACAADSGQESDEEKVGQSEGSRKVGGDKLQPDTLKVEYLLASTGPVLSLPSLPAFSKLMKTHPTATFGGFPLIDEDLQWQPLPSNTSSPRSTLSRVDDGHNKKRPRLFLVGAYAALQIGPGAFNLGGMSEAAERVASRLLRDWDGDAEGETIGDVSVLSRDADEGKRPSSRATKSSLTSRDAAWRTGRWSTLPEEAILASA